MERAPFLRKFIPLCGALLVALTARAEPAVMPMLRLTPDAATLSLALPSISSAEQQLDRFLQPMSAFAEVAQPLRSMLPWGNPDASLASLASEMGIDPAAPAGLYVDLRPWRDRVQETAAIAQGPDPWLHRSPRESAGTALPELALFNFVAALPVHDAPTAMPFARAYAQWLTGADAVAEKSMGGVAIERYGDLLLCHVGDRLYLSDDDAMLHAVLARLDAPATLAYNGPDCLPKEEDEFVLLTRLDHLEGMTPDFWPIMRAFDPNEKALAEMFNYALRNPETIFTEPDPCVTTLSITNAAIQLHTRVDLEVHTNFKELQGVGISGFLGAHIPREMPTRAYLKLTPESRAEILRRTFHGADLVYTPPPGLTAFWTLVESIREAAFGMSTDTDGATSFHLLLNVPEPEALLALGQAWDVLTPVPDSDAYTWQIGHQWSGELAIRHPYIGISTVQGGAAKLVDIGTGSYMSSIAQTMAKITIDRGHLPMVLDTATEIGLEFPPGLSELLHSARHLRWARTLDRGWQEYVLQIAF